MEYNDPDLVDMSVSAPLKKIEKMRLEIFRKNSNKILHAYITLTLTRANFKEK
jgi:hypothetical protein